jgi:hypothetical protein
MLQPMISPHASRPEKYRGEDRYKAPGGAIGGFSPKTATFPAFGLFIAPHFCVP